MRVAAVSRVVVVTLASLLVVGICIAQKPLPMDISVGGSWLTLTARTTHADTSGSGLVVAEAGGTSYQIPDVPFKVRNKSLLAKIDLSKLELDNSRPQEIALTLKIDDWSPKVEYFARKPLPATTATPEEATPLSAVAPKTPESITHDAPQEATSTPKRWYSFSLPGVKSLVVILASTLVLGCSALAFWLLKLRKRQPHEIPTKEWATPSELEDVKRVADEARKQAAYATRLATEKSGSGTPETANPEFDKLCDKLRTLDERVQIIDSRLTEPPLLQRDMQRVSEALNSSRLHQETQPRSKSASEGGRAGLALAAVVNRWIEEGAKDRCRLLALAKQIGMNDVWLANIDNEMHTQTGGTFECAFRTSDDGAWIWARVPGTQDFWVAPADAQLMGMGSVPYQLDRMFDGMQGAKQAFRFEAVYRPCCLRSNGGSYILLARGALKLVGSPAQNMPLPQSLEAYRMSPPDAVTSWPRGSDLGGMLASWIKTIDNKVRDYGEALGVLQETATAPRKSIPTINPAEFESLRSTLGRQRQDLDELSSQVSRIRLAMDALSRTVVPPFSSTSTTPVDSERVEGVVRDRGDVVVTAKPAREKNAAENEVRIPPSANPAVTGQGGGTAAPTSEVSSLAAFTAQPNTPIAANALQGLPANWKEAFESARDQSNSEPSVTDVPSAELYVQRVRNLRDAMIAFNPGGEFAVVHVKKDSGNATVEVHETDESATGEFVCRACYARHTWQLALSCGAPPADPLFLLFPAGTLGKGNFAAGYSALVDDLPSSLFSTEGYDPAQLKLQDPHTAAYVVWRKMTLK
jgi:hypothetical protein